MVKFNFWWLCVGMLPCVTVLPALLAPAAVSAAEKRPMPKMVGHEEILEMVDEWLYNFDEDGTVRST